MGDKNSKEANSNEYDFEIEKRIAERFATEYVSPTGEEVKKITFCKAPANQKNASGNRNYYFYINDNQKWTVGVSVRKNTNEIGSFGSNEVHLTRKKEDREVTDLEIVHWIKNDK